MSASQTRMYTSIKSAISNLTPKFEKARQSGALYFFESEVKDVEQDERRFQIRICPALNDKAKAKAEADVKIHAQQEKGSTSSENPKATSSSSSGNLLTVPIGEEDASEKSSPFKPPYVEDLFIGELEGLEGEEGMVALLNKYAVVPEHFLIVSKDQQPQSSPPSPDQLLIAYNTLLVASQHPSEPRRLLAFYNGGAGAGASQSWRHLQCVQVPERSGAPVEAWMRGVKAPGRPNEAFAHPKLPYLHLVYPLPPVQERSFPPTEEDDEHMMGVLAKGMMNLLDDMVDAIRRNHGRADGGWNLLMTLDHMHLIPRSNPSFPLPEQSPLEVNSLGYAGMLLVKSAAELEALENITHKDVATATGDGLGSRSTGIMQVLQYCGVPRQWGDKPEEHEAGVDELFGALESKS